MSLVAHQNLLVLCYVFLYVGIYLQKTCTVVQKGVDSDNVESLFYASSAARSLGAAHCKVSVDIYNCYK